MHKVISPGPENETFSTPPSSPMPPLDRNVLDRPSLSRRSSRPSNLRIQQSAEDQWKPDIVVDSQPSPGMQQSTTSVARGIAQAGLPTPPVNGTNGVNGKASALTPGAVPMSSKSPRGLSPSPLRSPCFVHSQLQGPSFTEWLRTKHINANDTGPDEPQPPLAMLQPGGGNAASESPIETNGYANGYAHHEEEEETAGSLTKQLAETAVGVREMSKQLGRTRVHSNIESVLIVTKARDNRLIKLTKELALYLMLKPHKGGRGMVVYVDAQLRTSRRFDAAGIEKDHPELFVPVKPRRRSSSNSSLASTSSTTDEAPPVPEGQLRYWTAEMCSQSPHLFDFVVTLGGDGTVLFTSWLFQRIVPPVLPFALGSLGFLTNFDFADHQSVMDSTIDAGIRVNLRMRFTCTVYRAVAPEPGKGRRAVKKADTGEILMKNLEKSGWEALENGFQMSEGKSHGKDKEIMCYTTRPVESFEVLNDLVVDRGPSPYVSLLELFGDEQHLTTVQADGLTISTPTGSTAYSLSAGGSLVHPEIPALLITPICPHTLSFRPLLLPDSMELRVCVPFNSRSTAWASFDGRGRVELKQGDHIKITASKYPFPTVCAISQSTDWFQSISRTLKWNERERQKSFVVVEESPIKRRHKRRGSNASAASTSGDGEPLEDDEEDETSEDEEEEEEKFDIDDLSSNESAQSSTQNSTSLPSPTEAARDNLSSVPAQVGREKAKEATGDSQRERAQLEAAARALAEGSPVFRKSRRSRSRSGLRSGIDTPDRFVGPHPHPPKPSPRHVQFSDASSSGSHAMDRDPTLRGDRGARDDIHSPRGHNGVRSRIPRDRDIEGESLKTPTASESSRRRKSKSRDRSHVAFDSESHPRRAFAVWGQDESDSATSDSDV